MSHSAQHKHVDYQLCETEIKLNSEVSDYYRGQVALVKNILNQLKGEGAEATWVGLAAQSNTMSARNVKTITGKQLNVHLEIFQVKVIQH